MNTIWFKCKSKNFQFCLETDTKPDVNDLILLDGKCYRIENVIWCLEHPPAQSGIMVQISPTDIN